MPAPKIRTTRSYDLFTLSKSNRKVRLPRHKKLQESMEEYGFLPYWPIVVKKLGPKYEILEGQHRYEVAKLLGLPIYFVESEVEFDIAKINDTQKTWSIEDYAVMYAEGGRRHYREAIKFAKAYKISLGFSAAILAGASRFTEIETIFKSGNFTIRSMEQAQKIAFLFCSFVALSPGLNRISFMSACVDVCRINDSAFAIQRLLRNAKKYPERLVYRNISKDEFLNMLEEVYNFKKRGDLYSLKIESLNATKAQLATAAKKRKTTKK